MKDSIVVVAGDESNPFMNIGMDYFIRTVTHYFTGRLIWVGDKELVLEARNAELEHIPCGKIKEDLRRHIAALEKCNDELNGKYKMLLEQSSIKTVRLAECQQKLKASEDALAAVILNPCHKCGARHHKDGYCQ